MKPIAIIEAPSILGLRPTGVEHLPQALIDAGLAGRLNARHAGRVDSPAYSEERDNKTGFLNPNGIAEYSCKLAQRIGQVLEQGSFALVLGGDCSILLGAMLAMNRRGPHGLLFLDGHMDFYDRDANINGEAASSELALATGRGPAILTTYEGRHPLVRDEDVVAFGFRDEREAHCYRSQPLPAQMMAMSLSQVRRLGVAATAREAVGHASAESTRPFWIHLDADVLDDAIMLAVDYRMPGGLTSSELEAVLGTALAHPNAAGMEVTILNPALDDEGTVVRAFVDLLARAMV